MNLGDIIKNFRIKSNMTMEEFSKKSGISKGYISMLEKNYNPTSKKPPTPSLETIKAVSSVTNIDFDDIIKMLDGKQIISILEPLQEKNLPSKALEYHPTNRIPILGYISAGLPLYAEEHVEGYTYTDLNHGSEYFALRVKGDSMTAARIFDNDILIVRKQSTVENGEIAVVIVDGENATVKRFYQKGDIVTLSPQSLNPKHLPQVYDLKQITIRIIGKVVRNQIDFE